MTPEERRAAVREAMKTHISPCARVHTDGEHHNGDTEINALLLAREAREKAVIWGAIICSFVLGVFFGVFVTCLVLGAL